MKTAATITALNCPNCGGALKLVGNGPFAKCGHCDTTSVVEYVEPKPVDAPRSTLFKQQPLFCTASVSVTTMPWGDVFLDPINWAMRDDPMAIDPFDEDA